MHFELESRIRWRRIWSFLCNVSWFWIDQTNQSPSLGYGLAFGFTYKRKAFNVKNNSNYTVSQKNIPDIFD